MSNRKQGIFIAYKRDQFSRFCFAQKESRGGYSSAFFCLNPVIRYNSGLVTRVAFAKTGIIGWTAQRARVVFDAGR